MQIPSHIFFFIFVVISTASNAETLSCPSKYSDEQINLIKHLATIGVAGQLCPNIRRNAEPLFGNLAAAWNGFRLSETKCDFWKTTYSDVEGQANLQIATDGLKSFCETTFRMYGPNGTVVKNGLVFEAGTP